MAKAARAAAGRLPAGRMSCRCTVALGLGLLCCTALTLWLLREHHFEMALHHQDLLRDRLERRSPTAPQTAFALASGKPQPPLRQPPQLSKTGPDFDVHTFYYMWYASKKFDGQWAHWNHKLLEHWDAHVRARYPPGQHDPDKDDIGSTFWPELGAYSSRDPDIIRAHLQQMRNASIGVAVVSWYPPGLADESGMFDHQELMDLLLEEAAKEGMQVAIQIEPYKDRTPATVRRDIQGIVARYGKHPALHRRSPAGKHLQWCEGGGEDIGLPVVYVYDSYHNPPKEWAELLTPQGSLTIRNTPCDAVVLCLWVERQHESYLSLGGFDGAYTYFASDGMVYGSTSRNWPEMAAAAARHGAIFVPSVGPGYNDVRVRPWNAHSTRSREGGNYFNRMFRKAISVEPAIISLTSWNEWHEGTNIEPAVPKPGKEKYEDYGDGGPRTYLNLASELVAEWQGKRTPPAKEKSMLRGKAQANP